MRRALRWRARCRAADVTLKAPVTQRDDWTLATVEAAAEPIAAAHGLVVRAFMVGGSFVPFQYNEMVWHVLGITMALDGIVKGRLAQVSSPNVELTDTAAVA